MGKQPIKASHICLPAYVEGIIKEGAKKHNMTYTQFIAMCVKSYTPLIEDHYDTIGEMIDAKSGTVRIQVNINEPQMNFIRESANKELRSPANYVHASALRLTISDYKEHHENAIIKKMLAKQKVWQQPKNRTQGEKYEN